MNNHRVVVVDLTSTANILIIGSRLGLSPNQFNMSSDLFVVNTSLHVLDHNNHRVQTMSLGGSNPSTIFNLSGLPRPQICEHNNCFSVFHVEFIELFQSIAFSSPSIVDWMFKLLDEQEIEPRSLKDYYILYTLSKREQYYNDWNIFLPHFHRS